MTQREVPAAGPMTLWRGFANLRLWISLLVVVGCILISAYAVQRWRRPGGMSLVQALSSDMTRMRPPAGRSPVELASVDVGTVESWLRYPGTAVGNVEQDVYPRVTGWITWMPFYAGDRVAKGQVLARLDARELSSRVDERRAAREMAQQMAGIARLEVQQATAATAQARADAAARQGTLDESRALRRRADAALKESQSAVIEAESELRSMQSELSAAHHDKTEAEAALRSAETTEVQATANLTAARAEQKYWSQEVERMKTLVARGYVSIEEWQRHGASSRTALARVTELTARLQAAKNDIRGAAARVEKSQAMVQRSLERIAQAQARVEGMQARAQQAQADIAGLDGRIRMAQGDLSAAEANIRTMQAGEAAAARRITQFDAGAREAEAELTTATVVRNYTEIRSLVDGLVIQRIVSPGTLVSPGQPILRIAQLSPIRVQANVAESDLARVRVGDPVSVSARGVDAARVKARVASVAPAVDPVVRTGTVEALLPNLDHAIVPGQYLMMEMSPGAGVRAIRVPNAAIQWESQSSSPILATVRRPYVWLAEPSGEPAERTFRVHRVVVVLGIRGAEYSQVVSGLKPGGRVVTRGGDGLREGAEVAAVAWTRQGPAELPPPTSQPSPSASRAPRHQHGASPGDRVQGSAIRPEPRTPNPELSPGHAGHGP